MTHTQQTQLLAQNLRASVAAKQALLADESMLARFADAVAWAVHSYRIGGRLYVAGNGGSAADAQHLVAELVGRLARERAPLPAEALTVDSSVLTAIGNDYGYEQVFARQLRGKLRSEDLFLAITTSGNSPNILEALHVCRKMSVKSILFTGHDGGQAVKLADYCIIVPGARTSVIQELHIVLAHSLCEAVEEALFPA